MSQSIITKGLSPTDRRGRRIKATSASGQSITIAHGYGDEFAEHAAACKALAEKLQWFGEWFGGSTKDGYAFIQLDTGCPPVMVTKPEGC
jgi:hypothetical protein